MAPEPDVSPTAPITVVIVDDERSVRIACEWILMEDDRFRLVGAFDRPTQAVDEVIRIRPRVVLLDYRMPEMTGVDCLRAWRGVLAETTVLMMSGVIDGRTVEAALDAGARGYLAKPFSSDELRGAIRTALDGGCPLSPAVRTSLLLHRPDWPGFCSEEGEAGPGAGG